MKTAFTICVIVLLTGIKGWGQISVSGANTGNGTYTTLGAAFTAINGGSQTGATISIAITASTTETSTATLNAGTRTSLTISPSGGAARKITGATAGNLINAADNVTIDGLNTLGNSLTIYYTATTTSISRLKFENNTTNTNCFKNTNIDN